MKEGNRGKRPIQNEPTPGGLPAMPDYFDQEQRRAWMATLAYLPKGLLTGADTAFCEVFAVSWATFREAQRAIGRSGKLVRGSEGQPIRNPWNGIARQARDEIHMFGQSSGMSPAGRTKLVAVDDGDTDPMELLLGMDEEWRDVPTQ